MKNKIFSFHCKTMKEFPFVFFIAFSIFKFSYDASSHKYKVKYPMGNIMRQPFNFRNISTRECISQKKDQYKFSKKVKFSKYGIQRAVTIQVTSDKELLFLLKNY